MMRPILLVSLAVLLSACSHNSPTAPTAAASSRAADAFGLTGSVFDGAGHPLGQARVEVLNGPQKGAVIVTDDAGAFAFGPIFTAAFTLRASKEGRRDESKLISTAQSDSSFKLEFDLQGNYDVTFAADAACTGLPAAARTRTYSASFPASADSSYLVTLGGADFARASTGDYVDYNLLYAVVKGDAGHIFFSDPEIWEHLTRETELSRQSDLVIAGEASGTLQADALHWTFSGTFGYCPDGEPEDYRECNVPEILCQSRNHQLTLTRKR